MNGSVIADLAGYVVGALLVVLGLRVHLHARREGALPDYMVALFFICLGAGSIPALLGGGASLIPMEHDQAARALGHGTLSVGFGALALFVWKCFGQSTGWRRSLALTAWCLLAALFVAQGLIDGFGDGMVIRVTAIVRGSVLAWAFAESLHYRGQLRRRLSLGIADPVVMNRFTLWCLWTGSLLASNLVIVALRWLVADIDAASSVLLLGVRLLVIVLALTASCSLFLAFFPPPRYAAMLRGRAVA